MVTLGDVRDLLDERPDLEAALEAVLEPDAPFTFDDVTLDSGPFGELVSWGIVESVDGGYRVSDPAAVRRALAGEAAESVTRDRPSLDLSMPTVPVLAVVVLLGVVAVVILMRMTSLPTVFYRDHLVLAGNDPYYYRYLVERLLAEPSVTPSNLGFGVSKGEPFLVTTLWAVAKILGGGTTAAGYVLAWYPVLSAALTALLVYTMSVFVTDDRRIGLAAVLMLAIIPGHALRTSLGFADHHAFDFLWLALTLVSVTVIARDGGKWTTRPPVRTVAATGILGLAVTVQTLAWDNSPIILAAIGVYLGLEGIRSVEGEHTPYTTTGPTVVGVGLGAGLAWIAHTRLGWHTTLVAAAPALVLVGGVGVLVGAELLSRVALPRVGADPGRDPAPGIMVVLEGIGLLVGTRLLARTQPEFWNRLTSSVEGRLLARREIAEVQGLFSDAGGWLLLLGFALFLALPYLIWASNRARYQGRWLPPVAFAWYFLILASIQVRFVGELAVPLVLFGGFGLVHLAERIDVARPPRPFQSGAAVPLSVPTSRQFVSMTLLFLLVGSLGIVQVPVKISQTTTPNAQADAAFWMADYNESHGMQWPSNYVFSQWGRNRMYNYFVNGESLSYGYAQSNFESFVFSTDPTGWYERLGNRRGFVVTTPAVVGESSQLGTRLHRDNGVGSPTSPALVHYRLVHVAGSGAYKVFTVVPGAVIRGTAAPNRSVTARTTVELDQRSFSYERTTESDANGRYAVRVAQPGSYTIENGTVMVNGTAVRNGLTVLVS